MRDVWIVRTQESHKHGTANMSRQVKLSEVRQRQSACTTCHYRIGESEDRRPPLSVACAAIPSSCQHGHGTVHALFSVRFPPSGTGTEMYQESGCGCMAHLWVRGSLEVESEHATQLPPRRPVPSVSTQVPSNCHLPATQGLPSIVHGIMESRWVCQVCAFNLQHSHGVARQCHRLPRHINNGATQDNKKASKASTRACDSKLRTLPPRFELLLLSS